MPSAKPVRLKSDAESLGEILKIVSSRAPDDYSATACFLLNATTRLGGKSPLQVLCEGDPAMVAKIRQLAIESLE